MGDKKSKKGFCSHQFQFNHIIIIVVFLCFLFANYQIFHLLRCVHKRN